MPVDPPAAAKSPGPVRVTLNVEGFGQHSQETVSIDRSTWEALSVPERNALCEDMATEHAQNHVGWGWHIYDPADYASTEGK